MKIHGIIWLRDIVDKLAWKHNVSTDEVEELFDGSPRYRFIEKGDVEGENLYGAFGRTKSGRPLSVFFIYKKTHEALILSARDMTKREKKTYGK